jgi:prepilin-type N-terminal cleavage/methylation domain-containing protein
MKNKQKLFGFTLIELLVVMVIIGILSAISIATFKGYFEKARIAKARHAAKQVEKLFLAQNASTEENLFTSWYAFDLPGDINQSLPYIIDKSEAGNDLITIAGSGYFSQDSDTGIGVGKSLRVDQKRLGRNGSVPGGPEDKLTFSFWFKMNELPPGGITYPVFLNSSAGFYIQSTGNINFYINGGGSNNRVRSDSDVIKKDKWYHAIGSYNGSTLRLWLDGELMATRENITQTVPFQGRGLYIGYHTDSRYFNGWVDEIMVFPYAFGGEKLN